MKRNIWKTKTKRRDTGQKRAATVEARKMRERDEILVGLVMVLTELARQK